jgi:hypothetical protein
VWVVAVHFFGSIAGTTGSLAVGEDRAARLPHGIVNIQQAIREKGAQ